MPKGLGKGYSQLTEKDKKKILDLYASGVKCSEIIRIVKTTKRAVPQVLKDNHINTARKNRYTLNERYFDEIDTERKAYWLGMIASDGCITNVNYFALSLGDKEVVEALKEDLNYTGRVYEPITQDIHKRPMYRINFSSKILCDGLRENGIHENKSLTYNDLPEIDKKLMPHFIRGYFDGDGSVFSYITNSVHYGRRYKYKKWGANIIATLPFCEKLQELFLEELDYKCRIHQSYKTDCMYYICFYRKTALKSFYEYMYSGATIWMPRKKQKWEDFLSAYDEVTRVA